MNDLPITPTIGIDRGASFTDFAVIESGSLGETLSIGTGTAIVHFSKQDARLRA
jgi:transketolase N-terminal domain/subunit